MPQKERFRPRQPQVRVIHLLLLVRPCSHTGPVALPIPSYERLCTRRGDRRKATLSFPYHRSQKLQHRSLGRLQGSRKPERQEHGCKGEKNNAGGHLLSRIVNKGWGRPAADDRIFSVNSTPLCRPLRAPRWNRNDAPSFGGRRRGRLHGRHNGHHESLFRPAFGDREAEIRFKTLRTRFLEVAERARLSLPLAGGYLTRVWLGTPHPHGYG